MKCLRRWPLGNCRSTNKLGTKVCQMLEDVKGLKANGNFNVFTSILPPPVVFKMSTGTTIGLDAMLSEVWKCLVEDDVGMIGLYGMGGVGKTTLMKRINNEFVHRDDHDFDSVIWVEIPKPVDMGTIQDSIRRKLEISDTDWESSPYEKKNKLKSVLSKNKFIMLLDGVQERLDLSEVGVPDSDTQNMSKVVFTTRSEQVYGQMAANKSFKVRSFKVQCLTLKEALELFKHNADSDILDSHPEIPRLAEDIAQECKGLPLALVTVGQAMARRRSLRDWKRSLRLLRNNPWKLSDNMEKQVYHLLEISYNDLNDPNLQRCFLYCCIFPVDYRISKDHLINLWIGEGLLDEFDDVHERRDEGEHFIESLKLACLLEGSRDESGKDCIKMHDVIRGMAKWIACDKGKNNDRILVEENEWELSDRILPRWQKAEMICICGSRIGSIGQTHPATSKLKTLIVRGTLVKRLPPGFFSSMKTLTVLDFSDNRDLGELPEEIGELTNLKHLDLSGTRIRYLPCELNKLTNLICLILDDTHYLAGISTDLISSLPMLKLFSHWMKIGLTEADTRVTTEEFTRGSEGSLIETMITAQELNDISTWVYTPICAMGLLIDPSLRRRIRRAAICFCDPVDIEIKFSPSDDRFSRLEEFSLYHCGGLVKIEVMRETRVPDHSMFSSLQHVRIYNCAFITDLSWLTEAPSLQTLKLGHCSLIGEIVSGETRGLFTSLMSLDLFHLPSLTRIYRQALPFPSLQRINILDCPKLAKLPLDSNSAKNTLCEINSELSWWNMLEWDDKAAKDVFTKKRGPPVKSSHVDRYF